MNKIRLAVIDSHPIQYHYQYFRLLADHPDIDLHVFYCLDTHTGVLDPNYGMVQWDVPVHEGYNYTFIPNVSPKPGFGFFGQINPALLLRLNPEEYDVIWVWGYSTLPAWISVLIAKARGIRVLFRGEATLDVPRVWWRKVLKEVVVRGFLKMVDGVAYSCDANRHYYEHYGITKKRLVFVPCAVDNKFFEQQGHALDRQQCRRDLGVPEDACVLIFVGSLSSRKRIHDLIQACQRLSKEMNTFLLLVGDGPLYTELQRYCSERELSYVRFLGFQNQTRLPKYYKAADVIVVASSSDPSPKVLNEGMNFGLPAVISDRVGTAGDLVIDGRNGYVVPCGDVAAITKACARLFTDHELLCQMQAHARQHIRGWSFENGAEALHRWLLEGQS